MRITQLGLLMVVACSAVASEDASTHVLDHRLAAWNRTIAVTNEHTAFTGVNTYMQHRPTAVGLNVLVKFVPRVRVNGQELLPAESANLQVEDFAGGVETTYRAGKSDVTVRIMPLISPRGQEAWQGAALYTVEADPPAPVSLTIGGQGEMHVGPTPDLKLAEPRPLRDLKIGGRRASFVSGLENVPVVLTASADFAEIPAVEQKTALRVAFPDGRGHVILGWGDSLEEATAHSDVDPAEKQDELDAYYANLLSARVDTPEDAIDAAFTEAIRTLEYNWINPYGWNECIHHWQCFWHNQHTAAAEWLGQEDRSRTVNVLHGENLLPSGAVPQYVHSGAQKRDFGGSNQFWAWQVRHYWHFTGDKAFAEAMAGSLERVIAQTYKEHDPDGNGLVAWGLQIGNQEDFIQFYNDGGTPSIEMVNMLRTRAELARGLGDEPGAAAWEARSNRTARRLLDKLWLHDLGRLANYVDEHGKVRLEAQYHTYAYPTIFDLVDELDGYTSLRHLKDRLVGPLGEVYCSNNFPNHNTGTWGMQAGAAQQPWGAWAWSKAGMREDTWRPLKWIADWVMDENHRGAWPEVAQEPVPAYFSPPAGLYVAATVEALFGLQMKASEGTVQVAPSFPDAWDRCSLMLPHFHAEYAREGNTVTYRVSSDRALRREVRWSLPPAQVLSVTVDSHPIDYTTIPGVNRTLVSFATEPATDTTIVIRYEPVTFTLTHPGSVAMGDALHVDLDGARILSVDDRCGVLRSMQIRGGQRIEARVRRGLLDSYAPYGRLGIANFSRRTLFVECASANGVEFWLPIDLTVLPRVEAAPARDAHLTGDALTLPVLLRNNTDELISGPACLRLGGKKWTTDVQVPARGEHEAAFTISARHVSLLSYGDNEATVDFPGGETASLTVPSEPVFLSEPALRKHAASRLVSIRIPAEDTSPYQDWAALRQGSHGGAVPWPGWVQPLQGMEDVSQIEVESLPGLRFDVHPARWVLVGERLGKAQYVLAVPPGEYRKFYVLMATFADNHDQFTRLGEFTVRRATITPAMVQHGASTIVAAHPLYLPGNVDWWEHIGMNKTMGTARFPRPDRLGLLPYLPKDAGDWTQLSTQALPMPESAFAWAGNVRGRENLHPWMPPVYPAPEYWASSRVHRTANCTFNVIEIDLGQPTHVESLGLSAYGVCPGFGIMGIAAETKGNWEPLQNTPYMAPIDVRGDQTLVSFAVPGENEGWTLEGEAFSTSVAFDAVTLNSITAAGESATGRAYSPPFPVERDFDELIVRLRGGHSSIIDGTESLSLNVVDVETGEILHRFKPHGSHLPSDESFNVSDLSGRTLRLELVDNNTGASYAWIGLDRVQIRLRDESGETTDP